MLGRLKKIDYICNKITKQDNETTKKSYPQLKKVLVYMNRITYLCNNNRHNDFGTTTLENVMTRQKRRPTRSSGDGAFIAFMFFGIWLVMIVVSYIL